MSDCNFSDWAERKRILEREVRHLEAAKARACDLYSDEIEIIQAAILTLHHKPLLTARIATYLTLPLDELGAKLDEFWERNDCEEAAADPGKVDTPPNYAVS